MSLKKQNTWTCDLCGCDEVTSGESPDSWYIDIRITAKNDVSVERNLSADFCKPCYDRAFPYTHGTLSDVSKDEFQKPFWKRFWGLKS